LSIRFKVILPYLLLTLVVAITGVYVVTKLVANSLSERLTNQLLEAGRVVSDGVARQEIKHLEVGRILAYTRGLAEALQEGDGATVLGLAKPIAGGLDAENLIAINLQGQELLHLLKQADGSFSEINQPSGAVNLPIVQALLKNGDPEGLPRRGLGLNPLDGQYYYYTAIPVASNNQMAGVILIGTSLDSLLPYLKNTSLADVIFYAEDGRAIASTMGAQDSGVDFLSTLSIPVDKYEKIVASNGIVNGETFSADGRAYSMARSALRVSNDRLGAFAVVLPLNFVIQAGAVSRNTYVLLYTMAMIGVVLVGYLIARLIINPLNSLVATSQAIASGDLKQRTHINSNDEIGMLANTFDEMTVHLQERTDELEKTYNILEQMDRTKTSFIRVSAHELRTPLTLIKGYTQMLELKSGDDPETSALTTGIIDGADRMTEIVNSMLDVSKIDNQTLELLPEELQIGLVITRVQKTFKTSLEERKIALFTQGLNELPLVNADPDLMYKVFYHLIMNAIKYTPDGGKIIVVGRNIEEKPGNREVEISISDTGIGIDPQYHDLIFEKFFQTGEVQFHSSGKTKFKGGGPGLGLAIARGIINTHGGRIWVESPEYNEQTCPGSVFYVRLPVNKVEK
jgi:signal transduction histidine kinase